MIDQIAVQPGFNRVRWQVRSPDEAVNETFEGERVAAPVGIRNGGLGA
jgi:hypothetical protein